MECEAEGRRGDKLAGAGGREHQECAEAAVLGADDLEGEKFEAGDEEEPAQKVQALPTPWQPTHSQYCDHCVTHFPYQSWCSHCVEVRGREFGHHHVQKEPGAAPKISFDYAYLSDKGEVLTKEEFAAAGEGALKLLIARDDKSKAVFAHSIPSKGLDEKGFSVDSLVSDVKWLGYSKLILKSDNEPAIVKLLSEALRELRIEIEDAPQILE